MPDSLLHAAGLEPVGPLGPTTDGARQAVVDAAGRRWAVTVLPRDADHARVRRRVAALAAVRHPHLVEVGPCVDLADGSLAVLQAEVPGTDLAAVRTARGAWRPGEVVTVVVPLAEALAALHDAGLAHGDVSPANVVLRPDGRPVLVDVVCADGPDEAGTPGLAAPERPAGATPAADVHALGRLGALLLSGAGAVGGDGLGALLGVLTAACAADPLHRPSARVLAREAFAACPPAAVGVPDAAVLARVALRRLAVPDVPPTVRTPRAADGRRVRGRHREGRRLPRLALAGLATAALVATGWVAVLAGASDAPQDAGDSGPGDVVTGSAERAGAAVTSAGAEDPAAGVDGTAAGVRAWLRDPVAAAVRLTLERTAASAAADPARLAALTVPGSEAARADRAAAARVVARGPVPGATVRVLSAAWSSSRCAPGPGRCRPEVRVVVTSEVTVAQGPPGPAAVVLVLQATRGGWRVSAVEPTGP